MQHVSITHFWSFVKAFLHGDEGRTKQNAAEKRRHITTTMAGKTLSILISLCCIFWRGAESMTTSDKAEVIRDTQNYHSFHFA